MGHGIIGFCSALGVLSISPENKPAVPVGYHTPCRSAQRELNVSGILPRYVRATTNTIFNTDNKDMTQQIQQRQMNTQTAYLKLKETASSLILFGPTYTWQSWDKRAWRINRDTGLLSKSFNYNVALNKNKYGKSFSIPTFIFLFPSLF